MSLYNKIRFLFYGLTLTLLTYLIIPINYLNPEILATAEIVVYDNDYNCIGNLRDRPLKMHFSWLPGDTVGMCLRIPGGNRVILIDNEQWDELTIDEQFFVVAHELGHCILDLDHRPDYFDY